MTRRDRRGPAIVKLLLLAAVVFCAAVQRIPAESHGNSRRSRESCGDGPWRAL